MQFGEQPAEIKALTERSIDDELGSEQSDDGRRRLDSEQIFHAANVADATNTTFPLAIRVEDHPNHTQR